MDRPRSRPQRLSECVRGLSGAGVPPCLAGPPFAQSPPSELIWEEHTSHGRPRFVGCHRIARAGLAWAHHIKAYEPPTLPNWHRSGDGNTLRCPGACGTGHDVKQVPPAYAKPFRRGHKNDFRMTFEML